jgi:hypothetical protein
MSFGRIRMTGLAVAAGLGIAGLAALPAGATAAAKVRVTITGVDSTGTKVGVLGSIYPVAGGTTLLEPGDAARIRPGTYWVGASVPTISQHVTVRQTLVMRKVTIRRSGAVTLSATAGSPVRLTLTGATATGTNDFLEACINGVFVSGAAAPAGSLYAVPVSARSMQISYATTWQGTSASYAMAGRASGGIPAKLSRSVSPADMAKVNMVLYGGDEVGYQSTSLQADGKGCVVPGLGLQESPAPGSAPLYLTPGRWTPMANSLAESLGRMHRYLAGHSYTDRFGSAVAGPEATFPGLANPGRLSYLADGSLFADPVQGKALLCTVCAKFRFALRRGTRTIASTGWTEIGSGVPFQPALRTAGWYTLQVAGSRNSGSGPTPAGLLSRDVSVRWHFFVSHPLSAARPLAASVTRYRPLGLNIDNQAVAGSTTKLAISVARARGGYLNGTGYNVKTIAVQASFDGGKTWHTLDLTRHGSGWLATVHDPSSGFVTLRSTVTDGRGDSTMQTIDKAYGIG